MVKPACNVAYTAIAYLFLCCINMNYSSYGAPRFPDCTMYLAQVLGRVSGVVL